MPLPNPDIEIATAHVIDANAASCVVLVAPDVVGGVLLEQGDKNGAICTLRRASQLAPRLGKLEA